MSSCRILDAVLHYLLERPDPWSPKGCIVFSQYFHTAKWVGETLTQRIPGELIVVYAGAGKSDMFISSEWKSVEREQIKRAVRERTIRLVVAIDAACEGLNLQTLGTLINIDLPWNPSRPSSGLAASSASVNCGRWLRPKCKLANR